MGVEVGVGENPRTVFDNKILSLIQNKYLSSTQEARNIQKSIIMMEGKQKLFSSSGLGFSERQ